LALGEVRRRWTRRAWLSSWAVGAGAAAAVLAVGLLAVWIAASEGLALAFVAIAVSLLALVTLAAAARPVRRPPTNLQVARFIEEQAGGLDDVVVTAVAHGETATPLLTRLKADASAAIAEVGLDRLISGESLRRAAIGAVVSSVVLAMAVWAFAPTLSRGATIAGAYLLPSSLFIDVTPGSTKVRAGQPVTITARVHGLDRGLVPSLVVGDTRPVRMIPTGADGEYAITFDQVTESFPYLVAAGPVQSEGYTIDVIRPVRVARIDARYDYPPELGLEPRVEEDAGDLYAPAGTTVALTVTTDKPVASGAIALADGSRQTLGAGETLTASLQIQADGSYRVALTDVDGLENPGETEYFIRVLDDRPPNVRLQRPGGDRQVTALEEVLIEARADDDFGLSSFEIVFQAPGKPDTAVSIPTGGAVAAEGRHLVQLEDLGVAPGDFVTYYARARDVGQGRRGTESRSDIFFLEVKPFEEAFVAAQSQSMGMQGGEGLQDLAEAQKEIIAATWKLDARARRARDARSESDIRAVAKAQTALRARAAEAAGQVAAAVMDPRRRRPRPGVSATPGGDDPLARAVEAMGRAAGELDRLDTARAVPHELEALEQLLKADADIKRRQVSRQQQASAGGASNRQSPDMSTLFDQQLRKMQQTNYETPDSAETRESRDPEDEALERVRELARRQEALQRAERELARDRGLSEEEIKRQLERLTREQQELMRQAEDLSRRLEQTSRQSATNEPQENARPQRASGGTQSSAGQGQQAGSASETATSRGQQMREIAGQMKSAASDLRRQDPEQASARSGEALERLRELSREMERSRPDERRRALGDLRFEAQQLADAERRLANEADRTAKGAGGEDARRRLAAEQERLADRTDRLGEAARALADAPLTRAGDDQGAESRRSAAEAAEAIRRERLAERMRESAGALRQSDPPRDPAADARDRARSLDQIAGQLGAATGAQDREAERLSEQLARTNELRDRVNELSRAIEALDREAREGQQGGRPESDAQGQGQPGQGQPDQGQPSGQSSNAGRQGNQGREGSSGEQGGANGGRAGRLANLQRDAVEQLREAQRLAGELRGQDPNGQDGLQTPDDWWPSLSAPGTEAFKQDFARWESLKQHLLVALERTETRVSGQLREREARERLNAGGHQGVSEAYRQTVDRYYQSLAAPRKPR
jgi:hypothetical protein